MNQSLQTLFEQYQLLEQSLPLKEVDAKYANLVRANGNQQFPVQRWFHLKEAFSIDLLENLLNDWNIPCESIYRILDPFCGVGTTLLASQKIAKKYARTDIEAVGIERNPFLHFVAQTKLQWYEYNTEKVKSQAAYLMNGVAKPLPKSVPSLSTVHREEVYDAQVLGQLLGFREVIRTRQNEQDLLLLGYASALEAVSGVRKDGRALRIEPNKQRITVPSALESAWEKIVEDLKVAKEYYAPVKTHVLLGDGRTLKVENNPSYEIGRFDLILYSPPYLNNIDYTEVYKIELWMCEFVNTYQEFQNLRYQTFRSHPSVRFPDPISIVEDDRMAQVLAVLDLLIEALPNDKNLSWRKRLFQGYFDDMYLSLKKQLDVLNPGGWIFCVVGNSLHGPSDNPLARVPVASDLFIALIAQSLGLEVKGIQVARHLNRRPPRSNYLRESVLAFRKPVRNEVFL